MARKTFTLFAVFIVLAVLATIFIVVYQTVMGEKIKNYISEIAQCGFLNEEQCLVNPKCEGIYGPDCPTCQDVSFQKCQLMTETARKNMSKAESLCQETGGSWQATKYGSFCQCPVGQGKIYVKDKGCVEKE